MQNDAERPVGGHNSPAKTPNLARAGRPHNVSQQKDYKSLTPFSHTLLLYIALLELMIGEEKCDANTERSKKNGEGRKTIIV